MIYLDSAATTLQKPHQVMEAVQRAMRSAASPGRGGHPWGMEAARLAYTCRERAAKLFHVAEPEQVVFTFNATHGLNLAIQSLIGPGDRVLISGYEHNAVTRALWAIPGLRLRVALSRPFDRGEMAEAFRRELDRGVDAVVCTHVSNVFGFILPLEEIAAVCREREVPLIVDASQSAGCVPLDFTALGAAFVAMPGHKGLYGPQGTGLLLCAGETRPLICGGTGSESVNQAMPDFLPDRLEAGTPNIHGIAGLLAGIRFVEGVGVERIARYERGLIRKLGGKLEGLPDTRVFLAREPEAQSGVLSFSFTDMGCESVGMWLADRGVAVRAGLHCAPLAHRTAGTLQGGTVRFGVSVFNRESEICRVGELLKQMKKKTG